VTVTLNGQALVEGVHDKAAGRQGLQQPFLLEVDEGRADRRARHLQPLDQRELGHALAGLYVAAQNQLAQLEQRPDGL